MSVLKLPSDDDIIDANRYCISAFPHRKADRHQLLNKIELQNILDAVPALEDPYSVASYLLMKIVQSHCFASANKRTGLFVAREFLLDNGFDVAIENTSENARTLVGIRERFYSSKDTQIWLRTGEIHEFKR